MVSLNIELPDGFLEEEERCGYTVTKQMKEVWAVELDLLCELLRVCEKYKIKIWGDGGTLLGAVRHKGFIPWDDDIDMMMFREDYTRLCEVAKEEFQYPYFFQTVYTDPGCMRPHAQLRNSETTGILKQEEKYKFDFNQGIFLDIFPLDKVVESQKKYNRQKRNANIWKSMLFRMERLSWRYNSHSSGLKGDIKGFIYLVSNYIIKKASLCQKIYKKYEKTCEKYNYVDSTYVSQLSMDFNNKALYRNVKDYKELIRMPFEFIEIPVPIGYECELEQRYGEWKRYVVGESTHGGLVVDTNQSYKSYFLQDQKED